MEAPKLKIAPGRGERSLPGLVQNALERIAGLLDTLFESAQDAVFLMDGPRFLDCNPSTLRMFGLRSKTDIIGHTPFEFSPERQPDGELSSEKAARLVRAALEGAPQNFEWVHCRLDRSEFDAEIKLNRFVVSDCNFLVAIVRDISERKRAEKTLQRHVQAEELITRVLSHCTMSTPAQYDEHMNGALKEVAGFIGVDHAYFLAPTADGAAYSCTHEFHGEGVAPRKPALAYIRPGTHPSLESALLSGRDVRIDSLASLPGIPPKVAQTDPGCRSLLLVPTRDRLGRFVAAIGFDSHAKEVCWTDRDVTVCKIIGNALTGMTERKRALDRLLEEKRFSDRLIDALPGTFYLYDSSLRLVRWNRNHELGMGYTAAEVRGRRLEDWSTPENRPRVRAAAQRLLDGSRQTEFLETRLVRKDGTAVPYLVSGVGIRTSRGPMVLGVGVDISARVAAEKALKASERNCRQLFNSTTEALFVYDEKGRLLDVNESALAVFGFDSLAEAASCSIEELSYGKPPYSQNEALEKIDRARHEGPQIFEWRSRRRDGTLFWSEVALRAFGDNSHVRIIASVRDITSRKNTALERERLIAEAQAANSAKDQFMAVLSHELRNPLAAIRAGVDLLKRLRSLDEPQAQRAMAIIDRNVRLQTRLVADLLDLSRLSRGKLTIRRVPVEIAPLVLAAAQTCRSDAERAGVSLEASGAPGVWADVDSDRVQQIVINLVDNAIKFTPKGGRVKVSAEAREDRVLITVEDTGVGLKPEQLPELFEMFRQGEISARRAPGLGIGLALVKSIVGLHGGTVTAESPGPGRGSRFAVALPRCEPPRAGAGEPAATAAPRRLRLLLLEDNADTRTLLAETLSKLAYDVTAAESGEEALALLEKESFEVVLADLGLPGMDGREFLARARERKLLYPATAFALTGFGQEGDVRRAREAGFAEHFVKPVDADELDRRIRSRLELAKANGCR